ncbi:efflux RND transporter periplasmic adaptor subunit [Natronoflexus pectinivorans]|uniref:HlyD family secretion protein n=1 Tax=Natronoflexus pectinivorans TaxID=682526 RepID=A0A4R2GKL3_9BACT|nr:efflux RND transporter periplasmic adaptor subunit [Natronoflexus pectinivorans]TCO09374.1 HlyD family secretion protein [Natronoflexus pectinivorans]
MDKIIEKKKGLKRSTIIKIAASVVVVGALVWMITSTNTSTFRTSKERITIANVEYGQFMDYISVVGTVAPITTIMLDVEEGGKVIEKVVEEGALLNKGDVIVRLENNDLNLQILNSESQLAYQSNELRNTMINMEQQKINNKQQLLAIDYEIRRLRRTYEQNRELKDKGFIADEDYLIAKENYQLALAERELRHQRMVQDSIFRENQQVQMNNSLVNMEQNLKIVRQRLEKLNIQAPSNGQLGSLNVEPGQLISRGERIGQLHILDDYKISADIDEHYIDRVRHGLKASYQRQNERYEVEVFRVYPEVRNGRFQVDFTFTGETPQNLRTGQTYHLSLELGQPVESVIIPRGGFFQSTGGQWIFVYNESSGIATKRNIRIGRQNPTHYEVMEGLEPGEKVITNNYDMFGRNERIEVR